MEVYFCVLIALGGIFLVRKSNLASTSKRKEILYVLAWIILLLVAGLRYRVGTDYVHYAVNYRYYQIRDISLLNQPALTVVAWVSSLIYDDYATWFFIMAVLTVVPVAYVVRKESIAPGLSTVFFVLLCCWHVSFNLVKQAAATAVIFMGFQFLRDRKFWKWCVICALATLFHVSAILMIPLYFLMTPRITWRHTLLLIAAGVVISLVYEALFSVMEFLRGSASETLDSTYGSEQLNILRVLVHCAPPALVTVLMKWHDKEDRQFATLYNISVFNAVLNVATANSAYLNRFAVYTSIFNVLFVPYLLKPFKKESRTWLWALILALYGVFWAYDLYKCSATVNFYWIFQR